MQFPILSSTLNALMFLSPSPFALLFLLLCPLFLSPLLQMNPFAERMCDVFMATDTGEMRFLEFLDMVSTFSPKVSQHL